MLRDEFSYNKMTLISSEKRDFIIKLPIGPAFGTTNNMSQGYHLNSSVFGLMNQTQLYSLTNNNLPYRYRYT